MRWTTFARVSFVLLVALGATGCSALRSTIPDPVEVQCEWTSGQASIELLPYGDLTYTDLPLSVVEYPSTAPDELVSGFGRWTYGDSGNLRNTSGEPVLTLNINDELWSLQVIGSGNSMKLDAWYYDEPGGFHFEKSSCLS